MVAAIQRSIAVIDLLVGKPNGLPLGVIAERLNIPKSAAHRTLGELIELGYVRQDGSQGNYILGLRLVSQALKHLARIPLADLARPVLDRLAQLSGELVRIGIVDGDNLVWVAKSQGSRTGLRYDPHPGLEVHFASTATGIAWLSTMPEERAIELLKQQGFDGEKYGPGSPRDVEHVLPLVRRAREEGYCYSDNTYELGTAAVAVPIVTPGKPAAGCLSVAGPNARLDRQTAVALVPHMRAAASELAMIAENGVRPLLEDAE
ncbi:IclR family transcriptional regulator [Ruicaihuangia caeni]|uniref:IclR family transcriptional regulator n=1 Tax=Ruicaihuangia caeni TaxID=3042517 RepID=A0AAW6T7Y1_9MICO|nr:IclR family transcriptional regulator [Klugiella sp. YN-L-19]MDI2098419.1 IclR family transcriptional regulator [Klugiella sp. YN-L-19]